MKVSIITITYNSEKYIENTIQSVVNQDYENIEYIIVDGLSTDNTLDIVNRYQDKISKIISEKDNGLYDAINKGIKAATGDIIGLIHSDDFLASDNVISKYVEKFKNTNAEGVYANLHYVDQHNTNKLIRNWVSGEYKQGLFKKGWMPPHPTFYVKKEVYERYGLYRDDIFKSAADYEFMLRVIHKHQIKVAYLPIVTVKMRMGGVSNASLKNRLKANKEDQLAWEINNLKMPVLLPVLKPLSKLKQYKII